MYVLNVSQKTVDAVKAVLAEYGIELKETKPELVNCCGWSFDDDPDFNNPRIHLTTIGWRFTAYLGFTGKMDIKDLVKHAKDVDRVINVLNEIKGIDPSLVYID